MEYSRRDTQLIRSFIIIFYYTTVSILRDSGQIWPKEPFRRQRKIFVTNEK